MRQVRLFPPLLLIFASLFFLYLSSSAIVSPDQLLWPLLVLCFVTGCLSFPAYWLTRDKDWASILLLVVALGFFSSGIFAFSYSVTVVLITLLLAIAFRVLKRKLTANHFFLITNLVSGTAIALSGARLYQGFKTIPSSYYENYANGISSNALIHLNSAAKVKPDIYYIIVDGYGRADMLERLYEFDNSEFVRYLQGKGFIIASKSHSNYPKTALSVTSTLNMNYIDAFAPQLQDAPYWWLMAPWLDHNLVRNSLEKIGYKTVAISSDWSITDNQTTDIYFKSHPIILSDFDRYLFGITPIKIFQPLFAQFSSVGTYDAHRISQLNNFKALIKSTSVSGPKFVFAHILLPHPPFVFSSDGTPINPKYSFSLNDGSEYHGTHLEYRNGYIGQVQFLNEHLKVIINSILENSSRPSIIILQADHGPGMLTDFNSPANSCLMERFSNFSAYYLPTVDKSIIPEDITPVNLFRIIFNEYFATDLPLLENLQYDPRDKSTVYDFENVTSLINRTDNCSLR